MIFTFLPDWIVLHIIASISFIQCNIIIFNFFTDAPVIKIEEKLFQRRSHSYIQHPFSHQRDRKDSTKSPENKRLSAVVSKYFKPIAKQTWQMDSSSWEFLNQINQNQSENATTTTACSDQGNLLRGIDNFSGAAWSVV